MEEKSEQGMLGYFVVSFNIFSSVVEKGIHYSFKAESVACSQCAVLAFVVNLEWKCLLNCG